MLCCLLFCVSNCVYIHVAIDCVIWVFRFVCAPLFVMFERVVLCVVCLVVLRCLNE